MPSNVEVKARLGDNRTSVMSRVRPMARSHSSLRQEDTYFGVTRGRLKLRQQTLLKEDGGVAEESATLYFYDRPDTQGPKRSDYEFLRFTMLEEALAFKRLLSRSLGVRGVVRKRRELFLVGQTRVHVDAVQGLGDFVELEVMLEETETTEEGQVIAQSLCEQLGIATDCLVSGSYIDLLPQDTVWE
uniref:CYTH domain-containing protein n=1 Tax=Amblyomma maculatum TaxID=34609 RepID=G3MLY0_AMBMU